MPDNIVTPFFKLLEASIDSNLPEAVSGVWPKKNTSKSDRWKSNFKKLANKCTKLLDSVRFSRVSRDKFLSRPLCNHLKLERPLVPELDNNLKNAYLPFRSDRHQKKPLVAELEMNGRRTEPGEAFNHDNMHFAVVTTAELPVGSYPTVSELFCEPYLCNASSTPPRAAPSELPWLASPLPSRSTIYEISSSIRADTGETNVEPGIPSSATSISIRDPGRAHMTTLRSPVYGSSPMSFDDSYGLTGTMDDVSNFGTHVPIGVETLQRQDSQNTVVGESTRRQSITHGQSYDDSSTLPSSQIEAVIVPAHTPTLQSSTYRSSQLPLAVFPNSTMFGSTGVEWLGTASHITPPKLPRRGSHDSQNSQSTLVDDLSGWQSLNTGLEQDSGLDPQIMPPLRSICPDPSETQPNGKKGKIPNHDSSWLSANHIQIEAGNSIYKCNCGATFRGKPRTARSNLMRHINSFTTSLPCPKGCGRTFSRSDNRRCHARICLGGLPSVPLDICVDQHMRSDG